MSLFCYQLTQYHILATIDLFLNNCLARSIARQLFIVQVNGQFFISFLTAFFPLPLLTFTK